MARLTLFSLLLAVFSLSVDAQERAHPNMLAVPALHGTPADTPVPVATHTPDLSLGYGAYNRFSIGRTDFGFADIEATVPYMVNSLRLDLDLSFYAGTFVPDRGTPGFDGRIYALTGGPNLGGSVPGLYGIARETGIETRLADADPGFPTFGWTGMAFDASSDTVFAVATDCMGTSHLYASGAPFTSLTLKGTITGDLICPINLMIDDLGRQYTLDVGLTQTNDFIYRIGSDLAATQLANDAGFDAAFAQGGSFNAEDQRFYLASIRTSFGPSPRQGTPEGELRVLDVDGTGDPTGATTLLGAFADDGNIEANYFTFPFPSTVAVEAAQPRTFTLSEAYPNPFNPIATLALQLDRAEPVRAVLYDGLGRAVRTLHDGVLAGGLTHFLRVEAEGLPSGLYTVRVFGTSFSATRHVTLVR